MKKSILGILLQMEGLMLTMALGVSLAYAEDDALALLTSALLAFAMGGTLKLAGRRSGGSLNRADSFLLVALCWILFSVVGMLPFLLHLRLPLADAFFEAMSGFSTTGATIFTDIDALPHALRFWRCITQWIGGLGIIVFSFALLPVYEMKNSNVYSAEVSGLQLDRLRPKIGATARRTLSIYLLFTLCCFVLYWLGPMDAYDAVCHGMTTVATGGFSTHTASIGYFQSAYVEYVCSAFMLLASINFSLYYYLSIRRWQVFACNGEMHTFLGIVAVATMLFAVMFWAQQPAELAGGVSLSQCETWLRSALFHVSTIISTSGFAAEHADYVAWGAPFWVPTLALITIGGCAGSTSGGVKVLRVLICVKSTLGEFVKLLHPRVVKSVKTSGQTVSPDHVQRTFAFVCIFLALVAAGTFVLTLLGHDTETSLGSSLTMMSNVGPGMGTTGPAANFAHIHPLGKWTMSLLMLVGRLEIFTVLFLLMPQFWKERNN